MYVKCVHSRLNSHKYFIFSFITNHVKHLTPERIIWQYKQLWVSWTLIAENRKQKTRIKTSESKVCILPD